MTKDLSDKIVGHFPWPRKEATALDYHPGPGDRAADTCSMLVNAATPLVGWAPCALYAEVAAGMAVGVAAGDFSPSDAAFPLRRLRALCYGTVAG